MTRILKKILKKIHDSLYLNDFPHITDKDKWITTEDGYWTGGFWIGELWWAYKISNKDIFKEAAYKWLQKLEKRKNSKTFDLGFLFYYSFVFGYNIAKDEDLKNVALEAADTLLNTYNEYIGFMYDEKIIDGKKYASIIIDIILNLSLLWWAYKKTGNKKYYEIAYKQAHKNKLRAY